MSDDNNELNMNLDSKFGLGLQRGAIRQDKGREIDGMRQIADALHGLPPDTCKRMLTWAADKYCNCIVYQLSLIHISEPTRPY